MPPRMTRKSLVKRCLLATILLALAALGAGGAWRWWYRPSPMESVAIFPGITYMCERSNDPEMPGLAHLICVDLAAPGIELFVTPVDAAALRAGWEYETRFAPAIVAQERLAVMINGPLYEAKRSPALLPGGWARSLETVVAEHDVNHVDPNSYLLWFEDDLTPHLEITKPPSAELCHRARWAIGGQAVCVHDGELSKFLNHLPDSRTLVGIDAARKLLFLAVFDAASEAAAARFIADRGVAEAIMLDGGSSTCLAIGAGAAGIVPRTIVYPGRALATVFGVRSVQR
jgi:hypothetical protein